MEWNEVRHVKVDANSDGQRIDNFLMKHLPGVPKSAVTDRFPRLVAWK